MKEIECKGTDEDKKIVLYGIKVNKKWK